MMDCFYDIPVIDCHVHMSKVNSLSKTYNIDHLVQIMNSCTFSAMNILSITLWHDQNAVRNPLSMLLKAMYPDKIYAFGGLTFPMPDTPDKRSCFVGQAQKLMNIGFDGIKMFGKPTIRKEFGEPFDSAIFDEFYAYIEAKQIPILFHVADPETFWDPEIIPDWAVKSGWFFGDGTFPSKETFYKEINGILKKFPKLKIIFAHFYFLSGNMDRASEFLDSWPNISFDITPGSEMYINFSKSPEKWHDFFVKYQDRILLGTDNAGGAESEDKNCITDAVSKVKVMRTFLETDNVINAWGTKLRGLQLSRGVLEKIYHGNFQRYAGFIPKKVNIDLAVEECKRILNLASSSPKKDNIFPQMDDILQRMQELKS